MFTEKFLQYLATEKRYSRHTITAYAGDLNDFKTYCETSYQIGHIHEAGHSVIRSWVVNLMEIKMSPKTVNRKLTALATFYKFLRKIKVLKNNPLLKVTHPKNNKKLPVFIDKGRMEDLLQKVEFEKSFTGQRDKLIITLFYSCGIRLSELINLKTSDINKNNIKVLGKRNKERIIPVNAFLLCLVKDYNDLKNETFPASECEYLLLTDKGEKLYEKFVYRKVNEYLSKVTSVSKKSPHVIRHTFATHLLNNGADLNAIKELLGHANLAATQVYTHNTVEKLKSVYQQAHPLGS
ncbi:MAG: tyrosine-type recombinase/integrase [Bacteroidota bacterium]